MKEQNKKNKTNQVKANKEKPNQAKPKVTVKMVWDAILAIYGKKNVALAAVILLVLIGSMIGLIIYQNSLVYKVCRVEAGVNVTVADFLVKPDESAFFTKDSDVIDTTVPGEYHVKVKTGGFSHKAVLYVTDTKVPEFDVVKYVLPFGQTCDASVFVTNLVEATKAVYSFVNQPDFSKVGSQTVQVAVSDAGNHTIIKDAELFISPVIDLVTVEAGSDAPSAAVFLLVTETAKVLTNLDMIDYHTVGDNEVQVEVQGTVFTSVLRVVDTIAPKFTVRNVEGYTIAGKKPESFVSGYEDATSLTYSYLVEPDNFRVGSQSVTIVATDEGGNTASMEATLTLATDTENPVISQARDFSHYIGDTIAYKTKVVVTDNCEEGLTLTVDTSQVNVEEVGVYPVTYIATDAAGNTATKTINMTVIEQTVSLETVNALCDAAFEKIFTEGMTKREKAVAIYNYIRQNVGYISFSPKGDYLAAAYEGFTKHQGDCWVYASMAKAMLDRAGIINMDIERIRKGDSMHFWSLVDVEDGHGWYHYDVTPRVGGARFCLWTEAEITEYSNTHGGSHNYDRSLYPTVN